MFLPNGELECFETCPGPIQKCAKVICPTEWQTKRDDTDQVAEIIEEVVAEVSDAEPQPMQMGGPMGFPGMGFPGMMPGMGFPGKQIFKVFFRSNLLQES